MHLLIDLDNTITDTSKAMFDCCEASAIGVNGYVYEEKRVTWDMKTLLPHLTRNDIESMFCTEEFFNHLELLPNAHKIITDLKKLGHTIEIVSCHRVEGMDYKRAWIEKNIPMIDKITLVPIEHGHVVFDKSNVIGDVIIDDRLDALASSTAKHKIIFGYYDWNSEGIGMRAFNWRGVYKYIKIITKQNKRSV